MICFSHRVTEGNVTLISLSVHLFSSVWDHSVQSLVILPVTQLVFASGFEEDKGSSTQCSWVFQKLRFSSDLGGSFGQASRLGGFGGSSTGFGPETAPVAEVWLCPPSPRALWECSGDLDLWVYKTEPAESGALALTRCSVVFLEETPFVMCPWVCQRSPATNSATPSLPVGSSVHFREFSGQFLTHLGAVSPQG